MINSEMTEDMIFDRVEGSREVKSQELKRPTPYRWIGGHDEDDIIGLRGLTVAIKS